MTIKSKITSVEYQESVSRAIKNSKNPKQTPVRKSPYTMIGGDPHKYKSGNFIPLTKIN